MDEGRRGWWTGHSETKQPLQPHEGDRGISQTHDVTSEIRAKKVAARGLLLLCIPLPSATLSSVLYIIRTTSVRETPSTKDMAMYEQHGGRRGAPRWTSRDTGGGP